MKNKFLILIFIFLFSFTFISAFSGAGTGTSGDPFQITTCSQLQEMWDNVGASYILMNDIDCSDTINWELANPQGANLIQVQGFNAIQNFAGQLDGQNYTIHNLYSSTLESVDYTNNAVYVGFFDDLISQGNITNLNIDGLRIYGRGAFPPISNFGGIVNSLSTTSGHNPRIENVHITDGSITIRYTNPFSVSYSPTYVGGLVGRGSISSGTTTRRIFNSSYDGVIAVYDGNVTIGGLVGTLGTTAQGLRVIDCSGNVDFYTDLVSVVGNVYGTGNSSFVTGTTVNTNSYSFSVLPLQYTFKPIISSYLDANGAYIIDYHLSSIYAKVGEEFNYQYKIVNPNNLAITWSDNSSIFDINSTGGISFTPTTEQLGTYSVLVTLTDGLSRTDSDEFTLVVYDTEVPVQTSGGGITEVYITPGSQTFSALNAGTFSSINTEGIKDWAKENQRILLFILIVAAIFFIKKK